MFLVFGVLAFVVYLFVPQDSFVNNIDTNDDANQEKQVIDNFITYSIVDDVPDFTESDDSKITQFLDSLNVDSPLSTEKFGIETNTVLIDSDQNIVNIPSSILPVSQLSVLDEQGNILDLGSIQTSFIGVTKDNEASVNIWGTVKFYLDDQEVATKRIWASSSTKENIVPVSIANNLSFNDKNLPFPPSFSDRKSNFTFTLSDEGRNWTDNSEHYYRVVLTEINANVDSDNDFKKFSWNGEYVAYKLKVKVDETKKTILDSENKAISIFKSDGTFSITSPIVYYIINQGREQGTRSALLPVSFELFVKETGKSLGVVTNNSLVQDVQSQYACGGYPVSNCATVSRIISSWNNPVIIDIPRDTDLLIKTNVGGIIEYKTPLSQHNMFISCENYDNPKCISNFGYSD